MEQPDADPPSAAEVAPADGVSLMITKRQRAELRALGIADDAVATMTPREAHELLREGKPGDGSV